MNEPGTLSAVYTYYAMMVAYLVLFRGHREHSSPRCSAR